MKMGGNLLKHYYYDNVNISSTKNKPIVLSFRLWRCVFRVLRLGLNASFSSEEFSSRGSMLRFVCCQNYFLFCCTFISWKWWIIHSNQITAYKMHTALVYGQHHVWWECLPTMCWGCLFLHYCSNVVDVAASFDVMKGNELLVNSVNSLVSVTSTLSLMEQQFISRLYVSTLKMAVTFSNSSTEEISKDKNLLDEWGG